MKKTAVTRFLAVRNLRRRPARSAALALLSALLAFTVFGGSLIVASLRNGLRRYEARLGADVVVVPYEARTKGTFESILLQGIPGSFYMDESYLERVRAREGVEAASPQFFLASASAGCCSVAVQVIGFDPETDFVIQPWIRESYAGGIGDGDLIVGSAISVPLSGTLTFYNMPCRVVAQLAETGTGLDSAVYANLNTIRAMMEYSRLAGFRTYEGDASRAISSVLVKVSDGWSAEEVAGDINIHVRHIAASQAKSMITEIADGLGSVSRVIGLLTAVTWVLALAILAAAFWMTANERRREFAVLRVAGAPGGLVRRVLWTESALLSAAGALAGAAFAALLVVPFSGLIQSRLGLPYLLPGAGVIAGLAVLTLAVSVLAGALTAGLAARRLARGDAGLVLREAA